MTDASRYRQFEERFVGQLRARAMALSKSGLPVDAVHFEHTPDGADSLRADLARLEHFDRDALDRLPGGQSFQMLFQKKMLGGLLYVPVSRVRVRTLSPIAAILRSSTPEPVGREAVLDALARYAVLPRRAQPTGVILASPTGFTAEARALVETSGPPTLVLMGGRDDGGWDVAMPAALKKTPWAKLLDLEDQDERLRRLLFHLNQNAAIVDSRGISLPELSEKLGMPQRDVEQLVRKACRTEPRLMTLDADGVTHVCRTPLAEEGGNPMGLWSRLRRKLGFKPTVTERVREMTVQRVRIEQERHSVDQRIDTLESQERGLVSQGAAATADVERKQLAGKLVRVRTELKRTRAQAQNLTNALDIIGTHIHHLTLAEQNKRLELPRAEELTREAAQAEQTAAELAANADLARSIEVGGPTAMMEEEEAAIFEEFKQAAQSSAGRTAEPAKAATTGESAKSPSAAPASRTPAGVPPLPGKEREVRPELG
jgi:hypothetical protein